MSLPREFGTDVKTVETATAKTSLTLGDRAETGIYQCCGKCSCNRVNSDPQS